jgi:hypothetical protein
VAVCSRPCSWAIVADHNIVLESHGRELKRIVRCNFDLCDAEHSGFVFRTVYATASSCDMQDQPFPGSGCIAAAVGAAMTGRSHRSWQQTIGLGLFLCPCWWLDGRIYRLCLKVTAEYGCQESRNIDREG